MKKLRILALVAALLAPGAAFAQSQGNAGFFWGNPNAAKAPFQEASITQMLDRALNATRGNIIERGASGWQAVAPSATLGLAWVSQGAGADPIYGVVGLAGGGCAAALSASNGGVLFSTASACSILAGTATARLPLLSGASVPGVWGAFTLPASVTSGGIPFFSSTSAESSSALLVAGSLMVGGGAGAAPTTVTMGGDCTFSSPNITCGNLTGGVKIADSCAGVTGNGIADDAPSLRTCVAAVSAAGGGTFRFGCNKTYLLQTRDAAGTGTAFLHPFSNVTYDGCGDSSVLKVANGVNTGIAQFNVIYPPDETATFTYTNFHARNFLIDFNGANNTGFLYQNLGIAIRWGHNISVENVTFLHNPGSQNIAFGDNSGLHVDSIAVYGTKHFDNCDIVNASCTDHSSLYFGGASDYTAVANVFRNSSQSTKATAIEMHGVNGVVIGNSIDQYAKACNIAAQVSVTAKSLKFDNNTANGVIYGCHGFTGGGQTLSSISVHANTFMRTQEDTANTLGFIDFANATDMVTTGSSNVDISDNVITGTMTTGSTATNPVISFGGGIIQTSITGNKVTLANGPCIGNNGTTLDGNVDASIKNNTCNNTGATATAAFRRCILISGGSSPASIDIDGNRCKNIGSSFMTTAYDITASPSSAGRFSANNTTQNITTLLALSGTGWINQAVTATLQASPSNPTGTASATGVMMGLGTTCKLTPNWSTRVTVNFQGAINDGTAGANMVTQARFGTGTAPANAAALTGTTVSGGITGSISSSAPNPILPFRAGGIITGLTPGTAYWFDLSVSSSTGTTSLLVVSCDITEF